MRDCELGDFAIKAEKKGLADLEKTKRHAFAKSVGAVGFFALSEAVMHFAFDTPALVVRLTSVLLLAFCLMEVIASLFSILIKKKNIETLERVRECDTCGTRSK